MNLKILTLNVAKKLSDKTLDFIYAQNADIICLQELLVADFYAIHRQRGYYGDIAEGEFTSNTRAGVATLYKASTLSYRGTQSYLCADKEFFVGSRKAMLASFFNGIYGPITIVNIHGHNGWKFFRKAPSKPLIDQIKMAEPVIDSSPRCIFLGDFNTSNDDRVMSVANYFKEKGFSAGLRAPYKNLKDSKTLDWIMFKGLTPPSRYDVSFVYGYSDHPAIVCSFEMSESKNVTQHL